MENQLEDMVESSNTENQNKSQKKVLMLIALGVVVLTTIIAVFFLTKKDKNEPQEFADLNQSLEKIVEEVPQNTQNAKKNDAAELDQFVKDIQAQRKQNTQMSETQEVPTETQPLEEAIVTEEIVTPAPKQEVKQTKQTQKPKVDKKPEQEESRLAKVSAPKQPKKEVSKPKQTVAQVFQEVQTAPRQGFYLQVGVFSNTPNTKFMETIKQYPHTVQKVQQGDKLVSKYLVGPYTSRQEAQSQVQSLADEFPKPFIVEVK